MNQAPLESTTATLPAPVPASARGRGPSQPQPPRSAEKRMGWYTQAKFEVVRGFLWLWTRMFSLRGLYILGQWFGLIEYTLNFRRRGRYRAELRRIFAGKLSRRRENAIIRKAFRRTRCDKLFYLIFDRLPREKILKRLRFPGRAVLDEGLAAENGVYVMISHNGSHHVAGLLMAILGYKCAGVRDRHEGSLRMYMQEKYARTFPEFAAIRVLYADSFPRDIYRCFSENRVVASALDVGRVRGLNLRTVPVQIFGEQREFLTGTLQVALRSRATIVQGFVVSRKNFYFQIVIKPLYTPEPGTTGSLDTPERVQTLMQLYADGIAEHVRKHPDHLSRW
jgi:lauroyl/myristoyl acyltransferase